MWIASAARTREMDRDAMHEFGIPAMVLMERAGLAVFEVIKELLPDQGRIAVVCGKGNNGGDGLVVARLAHEAGFQVECLVAATESELSDDARTQLNVSRAQGVRPIFFDDERWMRKSDCMGMMDLVVDALLGTGASGEVHGPILEGIRAINRSGVPVVSVDVPSGIDTDTGEDLGESVWALRTVTFGVPKPFLFQGIGLEHAGYWSVAEIGYPSTLLETPTDARVLTDQWVYDVIPERLRSAHKRDNGHVLVIAGSDTMTGAALLAAKAALRAGAGLVTLASTTAVCNAAASYLPEVMHIRLPDTDGEINEAAIDVLLAANLMIDSAVIGPGMGHSPHVIEFFKALFADWEVPSVLDADALNAVATGVQLPQGECVLTPHPGEMARLLSCSTAEVQTDRFTTMKEAAKRFGKTIVLKGPHTIVSEQHQPLGVNQTGNNGMATAGMGDVLSGVIGALLAQDLPPYCAACAGVAWHGAAGDVCADRIGPVGYLASDVVDSLPQARAKLTASCDARIRMRPLPSSCQF